MHGGPGRAAADEQRRDGVAVPGAVRPAKAAGVCSTKCRPESLPLYVDAGLSLTKLGEEGRVALAQFSLDGKRPGTTAPRRPPAEREGAAFRVVARGGRPGAAAAAARDLRRVAGREIARRKRASPSASSRRPTCRQCPCAIVEKDGRTVAFANLWVGENRNELLHRPDALRERRAEGRHGLSLRADHAWGKAQGYAWFSLGMAPLAGLEDHRLAPAWHKLGRLVYRYGENFYNFEGLRHYKDKFQPEWRPRYLAAPVRHGAAARAARRDGAHLRRPRPVRSAAGRGTPP